MHHSPEPILKLLCFLILAFELVIPFLYFSPRRIRFLAFAASSLIQVGFALTGNFGFFNLLAFLLGIYLVDDRTWREILPKRMAVGSVPLVPVRKLESFGWKRAVQVAGVVTLAAIVALPVPLRTGLMVSPLFEKSAAFFRGLHVSHGYGLFSHMTQERLELVFEGSRDGKTWVEYSPRYRPGDVNRAPAWVAPHQPRFDWQLWFAAFGNYQQPENRWVGTTLKRLLENRPEVTGLFRENPFVDGAPQQVRVSVFRYHFATPSEHQATGAWWKREWLGQYSPQIGGAVPATMMGESQPVDQGR
jgi:hypothetical protein